MNRAHTDCPHEEAVAAAARTVSIAVPVDGVTARLATATVPTVIGGPVLRIIPMVIQCRCRSVKSGHFVPMIVIVGIAVYGILAQLLGVMRWTEMRALLRRA